MNPSKQIHLAPGVWVRPGVLRYSYAASSGPGGQNVNRRSTKAMLRVSVEELGLRPGAAARLRALAGHRLTNDDEILLSSDEHRSQRRNKQACGDLLRALLVEACTTPKTRRPTKPTRGSVERRIDAKKQRSAIKGRRQKPKDW